MDDDHDTMLHQTMIICACFCLSALALVFLPACTPIVEHQITVPIADKIVDKIADIKPHVTCRKLDLPPVPDDVVLDIKGDKITANEGGETILRGFVACRSAYKAAPGTEKP